MKRLSIYILLVVAILFAYRVHNTSQPIPVAPYYQQPVSTSIDDFTKSKLESLGIKPIGFSIRYFSDLTCASGDGTVEGYSCYKDGVINLPTNVWTNHSIDGNIVIEHEYLHFVWYKISQHERDRLTPLIIEAYFQNQRYLDTRIANYYNEYKINELHSYECTELPMSKLPSQLAQHCQAFVSSAR